MLKQARICIKGDVISVGFRAWSVIQAKKIGVTGWVRNVYDQPEIFGVSGGVEAVVQGDEVIVQQMIDKLKQGPPVSLVESVQIVWETPQEQCLTFKIQR